ncbi:MAG: UvrD-helicase domain-containing protein, partial [Candidatus Pacebacteria bacterium]|nr:UvrD-helicase domain-containing protein [Candidatus Paceibacterota bacterium]
IQKYYQNKWTHIHIDEYQDTNTAQYELSQLLVSTEQNICVVGDVDQNIYGWRGADIKNLLNFEKDYLGTTTILLEQNYRSTQNILGAANQIIKKNKLRIEKNLFTKKPEGEKISFFDALDEGDEARFIAREAHNLIKDGISPSDIAVLYRANFQSRALEEAFLTIGVPYQVLGVKFFDRKEVKDILSYLKAALNPDSLYDIKRIINVPTRGIGKVTLARIFAGTEHELSPKMQEKVVNFRKILINIKKRSKNKKTSEIIKFTLKESGIEKMLLNGNEEELERLENIRELVTLATKYDIYPPEEGLEKLLTDAALASDQDSLEKPTETVKLMTVHAAKGLEFTYVFITGLEQDLFPHSNIDGSKKNKEEREEERRLFYVAVTRAKEKLYLSCAYVRTIFGSKKINTPSEFLSDIGEEFLEPIREEGIDPENTSDSSDSSSGKTVYLEL